MKVPRSKNDPRAPLLQAIEKNNYDEVKDLLEHGADVDTPDNQFIGGTGLHLACLLNYIDIFKLLLDHKANMYALDLLKQIPLELALTMGRKEIIKMLFDYGTDVKYVYSQTGHTILQLAMASSHRDMEVIYYILDNGVNVNVADRFGVTSLHVMAMSDQPELVQILIDYKADINILDNKKKTPLFFAARGSCCKTAELLLRQGANVHAADHKGRTVLHTAAVVQLNHDIVKLFLDHGANANATDKDKKTALHRVALNSKYKDRLSTPKRAAADWVHFDENYRTLRLLCNSTDVNLVDNNNKTALHYAASNRSTNNVLSIIGAGANINSIDNEGKTPLHIAASNKRSGFTIVNLLLCFDADVNAVDHRKRTPLHYAPSSCSVEVVVELIEKKADPNAVDDKGKTPLHIAASNKRKGSSIVKVLLDHNADVNAVDHKKKTPLHYAPMSCSAEVVVELVGKEADLNATDNSGKTPLHIAVKRKEYYPVVETLLKCGADVNATDNNKKTPLHIAASLFSERAVQELLDYGANPNATDDLGNTALHYVVGRKNCSAIVQFLLSHGANIDFYKNN